MAVVRIWSFMALQLDRTVSIQRYISRPVTYAVFLVNKRLVRQP
jgi:hypothetical protein